jgi:uncharacterized protein YycO
MRFVVLALVVAQLVMSGLIALSISDNRQLSQAGEEAHISLCIFKEDLKTRRDNLDRFLKENSGDFLLGNVPRRTLETSLANQTDTIESLKTLVCEEN